MNKPIQPQMIHKAKYSRMNIPARYHGHPFSEALPNYDGPKSLMLALRRKVKINPGELSLSPSERIGFLADISAVFCPLPRDAELFEILITVCRELYRSIIRMIPNFVNLATNMYLTLGSGSERYRPGLLLITGETGSGKSTSVNRCLNLIPEVIEHQEYKGSVFRLKQIPWLKIDYSYTNNTRTVAKNIALSLGAILSPTGRSHRRFSKNDSADDILNAVLPDLLRHGTVLLVLDNTEQLEQYSESEIKKALSFLLNVSEKLPVLVVLVGTQKLKTVVAKDPRILRRCLHHTVQDWNSLSGDYWRGFSKALWRCQYLREPTPWTPELDQTFYEISCGHPGNAASLFREIQLRAIRAGITNPADERITSELISSIGIERVDNNQWYLDSMFDEQSARGTIDLPIVSTDQFAENPKAEIASTSGSKATKNISKSSSSDPELELVAVDDSRRLLKQLIADIDSGVDLQDTLTKHGLNLSSNKSDEKL